MVAFEFVVKGIVQGVGYRYFTSDQAAHLGIRGYVKNEPDGSVAGYAEGDGAALDEFFTALKSGPPASRVNDITKHKVEALGSSDFQIRYY